MPQLQTSNEKILFQKLLDSKFLENGSPIINESEYTYRDSISLGLCIDGKSDVPEILFEEVMERLTADNHESVEQVLRDNIADLQSAVNALLRVQRDFDLLQGQQTAARAPAILRRLRVLRAKCNRFPRSLI